MSIKFTIRMNRTKGPSVQIYKLDNRKVNGRTTQAHIMLGILPNFKPETIQDFANKKGLNEYELFTLENYVEQIKMNQEELNNPLLEDFHREMLYFPKRYEDAIFQLWKLAKENNISFCPAKIMQKALLIKAQSVERKLNDIKNEPINIFSQIGINISSSEEDEVKKRQQITCRRLFRMLLNTNRDPENIATDFNKIATNQYGKKEVLKAHYIQDLATNLRKIPYWYSTVAIDLLLEYGENPLGKLSIEAVVENWLRLKKQSIDIEQAFEQLKEIFHIQPTEENILMAVIKKDYARGLPI